MGSWWVGWRRAWGEWDAVACQRAWVGVGGCVNLVGGLEGCQAARIEPRGSIREPRRECQAHSSSAGPSGASVGGPCTHTPPPGQLSGGLTFRVAVQELLRGIAAGWGRRDLQSFLPLRAGGRRVPPRLRHRLRRRGGAPLGPAVHPHRLGCQRIGIAVCAKRPGAKPHV